MDKYIFSSTSFELINKIDVYKGPKKFLMNFISYLIMVLMYRSAVPKRSFDYIFDLWEATGDIEIFAPIFAIFSICIMIIAALLLFALLRLIAFKIKSSGEVRFGVSTSCYYLANSTHIPKSDYIFIHFISVFVPFILLLILSFSVSDEIFWYVYSFNIFGIPTLVNSIFVLFSAIRSPKGSYIRDHGTYLDICVKEK